MALTEFALAVAFERLPSEPDEAAAALRLSHRPKNPLYTP